MLLYATPLSITLTSHVHQCLQTIDYCMFLKRDPNKYTVGSLHTRNRGEREVFSASKAHNAYSNLINMMKIDPSDLAHILTLSYIYRL